jgi:hypothetical protein
MNKQQTMKNEIFKHGQNLNYIFETDYDNVTLSKKLRRLERKANFATTCLCNTNTLNLLELNRWTGFDVVQATEEEQEIFFSKILKAVHKILGEKSKEAIFINYDARGYAIKIRPEFIKQEREKNNSIYTDFGGFGIVAPDFKA